MIKKLVMYVMILALCSVPLLALTGSIGNPRVVLRPNVTEGRSESIDRTVSIENVNDVPISVEVYVQEGFEDIAEIDDEDSSFVLQPGETRQAKFSLFIADPYSHVGSILVRFSSQEESGPSIMLGHKVVIVGTEQNPEPLPEEEQIEIDEELGTESETVDAPEEAQQDENAPEPEESSFSFSMKNPPKEEQETKTRKASPVIGIGILIVIVFIGIILFVLFTPRSTHERAAPKTRKKTTRRKKR